MNADIAEGAITELLVHVRGQLEAATAVAKAAEACAAAGSPDQAVTIAHDIEQPLYEANTLLNAVSLMRRIAAES